MTLVADKIAEYTAELVRLQPAPTGDLGFGSDLSCDDDITADAAEIAGDSPLAVAQALYRRFRTPRGTLPDDPNAPEPGVLDYGLDIVGMLNKGVTAATLTELPGQIRAEAQKDDRVVEGSLDVQVTFVSKTLTVAINGETALGPFGLTFAVSDGTLLMKEIVGDSGVS